MAQLAIKGHKTRGKEIIEILEMLGYINRHNYVADCDRLCYCGEKSTNEIYYDWVNNCFADENVVVFTLEEFLERFPYKVGDKVLITDDTNDVYIIKSMIWNTRTEGVAYRIETINGIEDKCNWYADEMVHYKKQKEETMGEQKKDYDEWFQINYLEFENNDDTWADEVEVNLGKDYEIQIRGDKTFIIKKQSQYPKTYEECCKLLFPNSIELGKVLTSGYNCELLKKLGELLICRDAYWKIIGEQMGLDKPWKPDWSNDLSKYYISFYNNKVDKGVINYSNKILAFPTEEMRDAFYENFKELIEKCKELL